MIKNHNINACCLGKMDREAVREPCGLFYVLIFELFIMRIVNNFQSKSLNGVLELIPSKWKWYWFILRKIRTHRSSTSKTPRKKNHPKYMRVVKHLNHLVTEHDERMKDTDNFEKNSQLRRMQNLNASELACFKFIVTFFLHQLIFSIPQLRPRMKWEAICTIL